MTTTQHTEIETSSRLAYVTAGKATVTLQSNATGTRFTYRVESPRGELDAAIRFVRVLTGSDNEADYSYLGTMHRQADGAWVYRHGRKSRIGADAPSAKAFAWFARNADSDRVAVHHAGRCGRCNRVLTVPESLHTGLGPICAGRAA